MSGGKDSQRNDGTGGSSIRLYLDDPVLRPLPHREHHDVIPSVTSRGRQLVRDRNQRHKERRFGLDSCMVLRHVNNDLGSDSEQTCSDEVEGPLTRPERSIRPVSSGLGYGYQSPIYSGWGDG